MGRQLEFARHKNTMLVRLPNQANKVETQKITPAQRATRPGPPLRVRTVAWLGIVLALLGGAVLSRLQGLSHSAEMIAASPSSLPQVNVTLPKRASAGEISLPATVQAYQATDLFARANGFLKAWHFDIGAPIKAGQVLAEIETPELEQELAQAVAFLRQGEAEHQQAIAELAEAKADVTLAEANVVKAKAHLDFALSQFKRDHALLGSNAVSRQEFESSERERDARQAELASAKAELTRRQANLATRQTVIDSRDAIVGNRKANVQRLRDLTSFQKIVAPFDGIVTRRNAEVGMLVTSGSNTGTRPLFSVAQIDILRVQASVPQSSALGIKAGDQAAVTIPERPGHIFTAKVTRTSGAVDPASRSLLVEVDMPNRDGLLPPGVYAQVRFQSPQEPASWLIEAKALLMRSSGPHVIVVTAEGTLRTQKVTLGRDFGAAVEVLVGLTGDERLVVNPSDSLRDGLVVQLALRNESEVQVARK